MPGLSCDVPFSLLHWASQAEDGGGEAYQGHSVLQLKWSFHAQFCSGVGWILLVCWWPPLHPQDTTVPLSLLIVHWPLLSSSSLACRKIVFVSISTKTPIRFLSVLSVPEHLGTEGRVCAESRDIKNSITLDGINYTSWFRYPCSPGWHWSLWQNSSTPGEFSHCLPFSHLSSGIRAIHLTGMCLAWSPSFLHCRGSYNEGKSREWLRCVLVPENRGSHWFRTQRTTRGSVAKNNILK